MSLSSLLDEPSGSGSFEILNVCTGNICRSPLAEGLFRKVLHGLPVEVSSAGTAALVGHPMTDPQLQIAADLGVDDASTHRARQLTTEMIRQADLVVTLSREHRRAVVELLPTASRFTFTLREFARIAESLSSEGFDSGQGGSAGMRKAVDLVAQLRGSVLPPEDADDDDVIDPYRQSTEVYQQSARQLIPAVNSSVALLRRAAGARQW